MRSTPLQLILVAALSAGGAATAQNSTEPPAAQRPILTVTGRGVQIYTCQPAGGGHQWTFQTPEATLMDAQSRLVGTHGAGPSWTSSDGSTVKGDLVQKSPSAEAGAIPWLLLKASGATGSGIMTKVEFIRRSETQGGIAPVSGCDAQHLGAAARIPYTATYTFYAAKP